MATIKVSRTTSCSRAINYAEPRATVKTGINCDIDYAKSEMKQIRTLYGKDDRVQAHLLIQSFRPGEITAEKANQLGKEYAEKSHQNTKSQFTRTQIKTISTITLSLIRSI